MRISPTRRFLVRAAFAVVGCTTLAALFASVQGTSRGCPALFAAPRQPYPPERAPAVGKLTFGTDDHSESLFLGGMEQDAGNTLWLWTRAAGLVAAADGTKRVQGARVWSSQSDGIHVRGSSPVIGDVTFPDLAPGDIVPVYQWLYRVAQVGGPESHLMTLEAGPCELAVGTHGVEGIRLKSAFWKNLPPGAKAPYKSLAIPLRVGGKGSGTIEQISHRKDEPYQLPDTFVARVEIRVDKIDAPKAGKDGGPTAELELIPDAKSGKLATSYPPAAPFRPLIPNAKNSKSETRHVKIGDTIKIGGMVLKVRNIVPRDEKSHVIGWVDLRSDALNALPAVPSPGEK